MKALKTATRTLGNPADVIWIVGSIQAASISLMLALQNLSASLQNHVATTELDSGPTTSGRANAMRAAEWLEAAARAQTGAFADLIKASESLSRVDWAPGIAPDLDDCRPVVVVTPLRRNAEIRSDAIGPTL